MVKRLRKGFEKEREKTVMIIVTIVLLSMTSLYFSGSFFEQQGKVILCKNISSIDTITKVEKECRKVSPPNSLAFCMASYLVHSGGIKTVESAYNLLNNINDVKWCTASVISRVDLNKAKDYRNCIRNYDKMVKCHATILRENEMVKEGLEICEKLYNEDEILRCKSNVVMSSNKTYTEELCKGIEKSIYT